MALRVGIYARISYDRYGKQTATDRQIKDCRKFAASRGWEVVEVFEDEGLSAWKRSVRRPQFERLLKVLSAGEIDVALAWKFDRVLRSIRDFARLNDAASDGGAFLLDMHGLDTSTPTGKMQAGMMAVFAEAESENQSIRLKRKAIETAQQGKPIIGGTRHFGYSKDRMTVIPEEAELIREGAERVLGGDSLRSICFDWNRRGYLTSAEKPWKQITLRRILTGASTSGQREHQGVLTPGIWPAILTPDETQALRAILFDPSRLTRVTARTYLLTGLLHCGLCDELLVGRPREDKVGRYVCNRQPQTKGCGKVTRLQGPVDDEVVGRFFGSLDGADLRRFVTSTSEGGTADLLASIRADEAALEELSNDYYAAKAISRAEFFKTRDVIQTRLDRHRQQFSVRSTRGAVVPLLALDNEERERVWEEWPTDRQRAALMAVIDRITLLPAIRGYNRFDPTKVRIEWKF